MNPLLLSLWLGCQAFDAGSTYVALHSGRFVEANPLMQHAAYPLKLTVNVTALWAYHKASKRQAAAAIPITMAATGCTAGAWNTRQIRSAR